MTGGGLVDEILGAATVEPLASGFEFTEGPVWDPVAECLFFTDIPSSVIYRLRPGEEPRPWKAPSNKANGLTLDAAGRLVACEHETFSVTRTDTDGGIEVLAASYEGHPLNGPNDVVEGFDGAFYFTDTDSTRDAFFGVDLPPELPFNGVYRVIAGADPVLLSRDFSLPNGLCFSLDGRQLYVNDTIERSIRRYEIDRDGTLGAGEVFFAGFGAGDIADGAPDGMKLDVDGNVYCTGPGGIWVVGPDGALGGVIEVPEFCGNFGWGGAAWDELFICASSSVYRVKTRTAGAPQPYMRRSSGSIEPPAGR